MILYFLEEFQGRVKVGHCRCLPRRMRDLQTGDPDQHRCIMQLDLPPKQAKGLEAEFKRRFKQAQARRGSEWYHRTPAVDAFLRALELVR